MVCYTPNYGYWSREFTSKGKRGITFDRNLAFSLKALALPCGQCIGCRLDRVVDWSVRCMHEKKMHSNTEFATFTYNEDCVPSDMSLRYRDVQLFWKKFRKEFPGFRYFVAGEYGGRTKRPHYHALLFGVYFEDRKFYKRNQRGDPLFISAKLDEIWGLGHCTFGDSSFDSAAYVASYCVDKITGDLAADHYSYYDDDGVIHEVECEFGQPSLKPAIGKFFFEKYWREIYTTDSCVVNGREYPVPRYYDKLLEGIDPVLLASVKAKRIERAERMIAIDKSIEGKYGIPRQLVKHIVALDKRRQKGEL